MIQAKAISGFYEYLPEKQMIEEKYKNIIKNNYNLSGFVTLDTPAVERLEVLTSKGAEDSEIYALHRIHDDGSQNASLGLRFDLTVPLARYIGQYEGELNFPFKRQAIGRVYRGERPQKGRYREFYQADIDIIGNGKLPLFADVEILSTIYSALNELEFGEFVIHMNNKKFLSGYLEYIQISQNDIIPTIRIIDKKQKVKKDVLEKMLREQGLNDSQIQQIDEFLELGQSIDAKQLFETYKDIENELLQEGLQELQYVYDHLIHMGIKKESLQLNPSISRGLDYYTGVVFETFVSGGESLGSIASGGRYENLASNFTKNSYPGVGGSIGVSRLLAVLFEMKKIDATKKTPVQVMVVNTGEEYLKKNLSSISKLRKKGLSVELYIDSATKMQKQLKYANNKQIPFVIIQAGNEIEKKVVQLKNLESGTQQEVGEKDIYSIINHYEKTK